MPKEEVKTGQTKTTRMARVAPARSMVFLSRNAEVRESRERIVFAGGQPRLTPTVVLGSIANMGERSKFETEQIQQAGAILTNFLVKIAKVQCSLASAEEVGPRVFLGAPNGKPTETFPELQGIDGHGFLVTTQGDDLHIVAPTGVGTLYGVWFYLMNYAGLRLVMPGELGEIYEPVSQIEIPRELRILNPGPDFLLRVWSGAGGFDRTAWLGDTEATQRFDYHHAQYRIFEPARFGKTHPEYYPIINGERYIPSPHDISHWQPSFHHPEVVARSAAYVGEQCRSRPDLKSVSLSVNDGYGYCEEDLALAKTLPGGIGDVYCKYINEVAGQVKAEWPGRYVAFFPYLAVKEPPSFKMEDNVLVFLINFQGNPLQDYEKWKDHAAHFGVYQWLYGMGWVIPNQWPHAARDYLKDLHRRGVVALKGEFYGPWSQDGSRQWVLNNLLWNTDADVDSLLDDYYRHAYGEKAAPAMTRFFGQAEAMYERRRTPGQYDIARWLPGAFTFKGAAEDDFCIMTEALAEARAKVSGESNRQRVELTAKTFEYGRIWWNQYQAFLEFGKLRAEMEKHPTVEGLEKLLSQAARFYELEETHIQYLDQVLWPSQPYAIQGPPNSTVAGKIAGWGPDPRFRWGDLDDQVDQAAQRLTELKGKTPLGTELAAWWKELEGKSDVLKPYAEKQRLALLHPHAKLKNLISNGGFEEAENPADEDQKRLLKQMQVHGATSSDASWRNAIIYADADAYTVPGLLCRDWARYQKRVSTARSALDSQVKHSGAVSMNAKGKGQHCGVLRHLKLTNRSRYRLSFWYRTAHTTPAEGQPMAGIAFYRVSHFPFIEKPFPPSGEWKAYQFEFTVNIPPGDDSDCTLVLYTDKANSNNSQLWVDDVRLELLSPAGIAEGG